MSTIASFETMTDSRSEVVKRFVIRAGKRHLDLEEAIRLRDQTTARSSVIRLDACEVLALVLIGRDQLPPIAAVGRELVDEVLIRDAVDGDRIVWRRGVAKRAQRERQRRQPLLAVDHEVRREGRRSRRLVRGRSCR